MAFVLDYSPRHPFTCFLIRRRSGIKNFFLISMHVPHHGRDPSRAAWKHFTAKLLNFFSAKARGKKVITCGSWTWPFLTVKQLCTQVVPISPCSDFILGQTCVWFGKLPRKIKAVVKWADCCKFSFWDGVFGSKKCLILPCTLSSQYL